MQDEVIASDEPIIQSTRTEPPQRRPYTVTDKVVREEAEDSNGSEGIFKNGKLYKPGDTIELDERTAQNFLALGEIE